MSGQLLGVVDYFDELVSGESPSKGFPAALALRRMYQEAQKGKFSKEIIEAMIRTLGVFPVGTLVQLSSGEQGVVVKQNPGDTVNPQVKLIQGANGQTLDEPLVKNLAVDREQDVGITKVLLPTDSPINVREYF